VKILFTLLDWDQLLDWIKGTKSKKSKYNCLSVSFKNIQVPLSNYIIAKEYTHMAYHKLFIHFKELDLFEIFVY
jgi:hypothetical protein